MFKQSVAELVEMVREVCPLPSSTTQLMLLLGDPEVRLDRIAEVISTDPALAAEVMRIANGSHYAPSRKLTDLGQAIMTIGLGELRSMAMAMSMLAAFRTGKELAFDFHDTAVLSGSVARTLAADVKVNKNEAFLCGLLCEIGAMACAAVDCAGYAEIWGKANGQRLLREQLESEHYGAPAKQVGARLLQRNGLPDSLALAVGDSISQASAPLARLTHFAREAAPCIVRARSRDDATLSAELSALCSEAHFEFDQSVLPERCLGAAGVALTAIRRANR